MPNKWGSRNQEGKTLLGNGEEGEEPWEATSWIGSSKKSMHRRD